MQRNFTERTHSSGRVDREAGVIFNVKLLGANSKNGRRYTADAMAEAVGLYAGKKVFIGHPDTDRMGEDRKFEDWAGVIVSPRFERGAIYGDIRLRKQSPRYEELIEAAESFDVAIGMSHVAEGDSKNYHGEEVVESIVAVYSVDIVLEPATTAGLYEAKVHTFDDDTELSALIPRLRGVVVKALKIPALASSEELEFLVDAIDEMEQTEELKAAAEKVGFDLQPHEEDSLELPVHESYDCLGRPRRREFTSEALRRFADRLR